MPRVSTPKGTSNGQLTLSRFFSPKQKDSQENSKPIDGRTTPMKTSIGSDEDQDDRPMKRTRLANALGTTDDNVPESEEKQQDTSETTEPKAPSTPETKAEPKTVLTPDVMLRIKEKELAAKILRLSKEFPVVDCDIGKSWFQALEAEFKKEYFAKLSQFVMSCRASKTVYPPSEHVWEWTKQVPIKDVKVVILGQDPYHGPNQAHGLCFSVKKGIAPPPSLQNMYKELATDIPGFTPPGHGCLSGWAEQGVLLLNAVLTVERGNANSHKDKGWEKITDAVVKYISNNSRNVVFFLWGAYAKKKGSIVDKKKHYVLEGPHPSPFSAHSGFFGCKHFSKCNAFLEKNGKKPIDWTHLP